MRFFSCFFLPCQIFNRSRLFRVLTRSPSSFFSHLNCFCPSYPGYFAPSRLLSVFRPNFRFHPLRSLFVEFGLTLTSYSFLRLSGGVMSMTSSMAEEAISPAKKFWLMSQKEAMLAKYTPLVILLASGKLEQETFRHYIAQDAHFLRSFARAYEKAEEYADDDDAKSAISELRIAVMEEMKLHNTYVQDWGVHPGKDISPNPATLRYINFLSATSDGKIEVGKGVGKIVTPFEMTKVAAYIVGAMVPCMRLYAFLGKELESFLNHIGSSHLYTSWVKIYSLSTFEEAAAQIEDLLDRLSVPLTGEELDVIQQLYHQAMKLEIDFFLAQPIVQPSVLPLSKMHDPKKHIFILSDFDLTCTVVDSSAILAEIAIVNSAKSAVLLGNDQPINEMSSSNLRKLWRGLSEKYMEEYEQCTKSLLSHEKANTYTSEDLCKCLEEMSDFEKTANSRVIQSGVLKGMNVNDIRRAGEHINFQDGCLAFFQKIVSLKEILNVDINILSFCWCADFIRAAFTSGCVTDVAIHSNELEYNESISTGEIIRKIETPLEKIQAFKTILNQNSDAGHLTVYIGDSIGDLLCLLEADIGIVIGFNESLRKVGMQFGVSFIPLFQGLVHKQREFGINNSSVWQVGHHAVLYTVSSWQEIHVFIMGHESLQ